MIKKVYQLILETYPFLTKAEKSDFIKQSKTILNKKLSVKTVKKMLSFLHNPHADIFLKKNKTGKTQNISLLPTHKFFKDILYIKIPAWNGSFSKSVIDKNLIKICVDARDKYKTLVIDVRENGGGNSSVAHRFAGIFFKKDVLYGKTIRKNSEGELYERPMILQANGKIYLDKKIIILISQKCFSSNELFLAPFKVSKRATLIGEKTKGGSGNPITEEIEIDGKNYNVRVPRWRFFLKGKSKPIEETAIEPDINFKSHKLENIMKKISV